MGIINKVCQYLFNTVGIGIYTAAPYRRLSLMLFGPAARIWLQQSFTIFDIVIDLFVQKELSLAEFTHIKQILNKVVTLFMLLFALPIISVNLSSDGLLFILSISCSDALSVVTGVFKLMAGYAYKIIFLLL